MPNTIRVDAAKLLHYMHKRGLNYRTLARVAGLSVGQLHGIINGTQAAGNITISALARLGINDLFYTLDQKTGKMRRVFVAVGPVVDGEPEIRSALVKPHVTGDPADKFRGFPFLCPAGGEVVNFDDCGGHFLKADRAACFSCKWMKIHRHLIEKQQRIQEARTPCSSDTP